MIPKAKIDLIQYSANSFKHNELESIESFQREKDQDGEVVTWIRVLGQPDSKELSKIADRFGFHQLVVEDILGTRQRPKVETYGAQLFLILRAPELSQAGFQTHQVAVMQCHGVVITFHDHHCQHFFAPIEQRIAESIGCVRDQKIDYLIYSLLDAVIDGYFPILERVEQRIKEVETTIAESAGVGSIAMLQNLRSELFKIRGAIEPHQEVVSQLSRNPQMGEETRIFLRDCTDHISQVLHLTENSREQATDLRDFCFAELSFNQNEIMKLLTVVASIFIPLSFVAGLYGMNFDPAVSSWNMPELKLPFGYIAVLILMAAIAVRTLIVLRWLGRRQAWKRKRRFEEAQKLF